MGELLVLSLMESRQVIIITIFYTPGSIDLRG